MEGGEVDRLDGAGEKKGRPEIRRSSRGSARTELRAATPPEPSILRIIAMTRMCKSGFQYELGRLSGTTLFVPPAIFYYSLHYYIVIYGAELAGSGKTLRYPHIGKGRSAGSALHANIIESGILSRSDSITSFQTGLDKISSQCT